MAHPFRNTHTNGYCFVRFHHDLISYDTIFYIEKKKQNNLPNIINIPFLLSLAFQYFRLSSPGSSSMTSRTHAYRQSHSGVFPMDRCLYGRNPGTIRHTGISFLSTSFTVMARYFSFSPRDVAWGGGRGDRKSVV